MNSKNRFILINLLLFEFVLLNIVLISFLYFRLPDFSLTDPGFLKKMIPLVIIYNFSWLFIVLYIRDNEFYLNPHHSFLKSLLISLFFFVGVVTMLIIVLKMNYFNRSTFIAPIFIFTYFNLIAYRYLIKYLKKRGSHLFADTLLISSDKEAAHMKNFATLMTNYGYNIIGCLNDGTNKSGDASDFRLMGHIDELKGILSNYAIDEIFISMSDLRRDQILESIDVADDFGIRVKLIPESPLFKAKKYRVGSMGDLAVFKLRQSPLDSFNKIVFKRLFDICFSLLVLILLSPLFLLIALLIFLESGTPIFYTPYRKGEAGKTFKCYKFRTMYESDNPVNGTKSTVENDPRITRVGRFLRKNDLDELPQFFNVLKGDMSVIGPRPHRINLQNDLRKSVNDYMVRSYIKPGITGWAQVNGWRGPTVTEEQKNERVKHDLWYIENWSFWLDFKIIFSTIFGDHHKKAF